jgi:hypothetical protein
MIDIEEPERFHWGFYARWWDCVREQLDMETGRCLLALNTQEWSYVELYEIEDDCIAATQDTAVAIFRWRYPWIENYHITLNGPVKKKKPATLRKRRKKKKAAEA